MMIDRLCWGAWSIARPRLVRCDAHWHRPKRSDWRAKAYERAARWLCDPMLLIHNEQQYSPWFPDTHCVDGNVAEGCR